MENMYTSIYFMGALLCAEITLDIPNVISFKIIYQKNMDILIIIKNFTSKTLFT